MEGHNGSVFTVSRMTRSGAQTLTFRKTDSGVKVTAEDDKVLHAATLTLGEDGECRLKLNREELEFWQFRRRALEDLFFGF